MKNISDRQWAYVTLRLTLGINMLMHGLTRVISGVGGFADKVSGEFETGFLPLALVRPFLMVLPFVELVVGVLMVLGLFTRYGLLLGAFTITALTFGSTSVQNWSAAGIQLTYAIAFAILLFGREYNRLCVDKVHGEQLV